MKFKLDYDVITEDICRVCCMTGGVRVASEENAKHYTKVLRRLDDPVEKGDFIFEDPCVGEDMLNLIRENEGRDCPRVDLLPGNRIAADLIFPLINTKYEAGGGGMEGTPTGVMNATLWPVWFQYKTRRLDDAEKEEILNRIVWALNDEDVRQLLTVQMEKKES